eukprot:jgi/Mesen1/6415/ME000329S05579
MAVSASLSFCSLASFFCVELNCHSSIGLRRLNTLNFHRSAANCSPLLYARWSESSELLTCRPAAAGSVSSAPLNVAVPKIRKSRCERRSALRATSGDTQAVPETFLNDERQLDAARRNAQIRAKHHLRSDALVSDPYAACLASTSAQGDGPPPAVRRDERTADEAEEEGADAHGMDTRPHRLAWPPGTVLFDVSPAGPFAEAKARLKAAGARVAKGCVLRHVSADLATGDDWRDEGWGEKLVRMGYRGDRSSVWALQGVEGLTAHGWQVILGHVSTLAKCGSCFVGDLPLGALSSPPPEEAAEVLRASLAKQGFLAQPVTHAEVARQLDRWQCEEDSSADSNMELAAAEIAAAEEAGDEMGFEDMP